MATTVNIHEAKTHFSQLVDRAAKGEEIIIAKAGKPVARLTPINESESVRGARRGFGFAKDLFTEEQVEAMFDPTLDKEIEDLFYNGPLFPEE